MQKNTRPKIEDILAKEFPLGAREDRVVIYPDEPAKKTESGIFIPDTAQRKPSTGIVVEVGPGNDRNSTHDLERGTQVIYGRYAGTDIDWENVTYVVVRQSDIMLRNKTKLH